MISFIRRHSDKIKPRKAELLTKSRSDSLTEHVLDYFYYDLLNGSSQYIYLDETWLNIDPRSKEVFVDPKSKDAYLMSATCGKTVFCSILLLCNWSLFTAFCGVVWLHLNNKWCENAPAKCAFGMTRSGWMESDIFESWFINHFVTFVSDNIKHVVLIYDGHGSHLTYKTIKAAFDKNIIILCLPPNCSHAMQPLGVAVFGPLKKQWKQILKSWFRESRLQSVTKEALSELLKQLFEHVSEQHAIAGFRGAGLWPIAKKSF